MKKLRISQIKPNPLGKDRLGNVVPASQLAGEWVDFKNAGDESYPMDNISLQHIAYTAKYPKGVWEKVMGFTGGLEINKVA